MTLNGKREHFTMEDFRTCAQVSQMMRGRADTIIDEVRSAIVRWPEFADRAQIKSGWLSDIQNHQRLEFPLGGK